MNQKADTDDMRSEYDFSGGVRGKHHKAYQESANVVLLDPEVARVFRDSTAVNRALRMLIDLADREVQRNLLKSKTGSLHGLSTAATDSTDTSGRRI